MESTQTKLNQKNLCFTCSREFCEDRQTINSPRVFVSKCWKYEKDGFSPPPTNKEEL